LTAATGSNDPVPGNNSASISVVSAIPAPAIVASGATLIAESLTPANGAIEPGETVTVSFRLVNNGSADTTGLVATLQSTGGVTLPSGPQNYGALVHGGASAARSFSFTATGTTGGVVTATLQLQDGAKNLGTVTFAFNFVTTAAFANTGAITIPESGPASPYPSTINVSGLAGLVTNLKLTVNGLTHGFPEDLRMLLVGPSGQKLVFMAGVGGGYGITNVTLAFDDAAASALPASSLISSGTFKPTNNGSVNSLPFPAPVAPYGQPLLSNFNGTDPNGNWSLYVLDGATGDGGSISGGWSLSITIVSPINPAADMVTTMTSSSGTIHTGDQFTYTVKVANNGPATSSGVILTDTLPVGLNFISAVASQGVWGNASGTVTWNVGSLNSAANATLTVTASAATAGVFTNNATVTANEIDLNTANNASQASVTVLTIVPPRLANSSMQTNGNFQMTLIGQAGESYVIQASTNLINWTSVITNTISASGNYKFADTNSLGFNQRYYRAVRVP
ncbi:MAG: hypothetical protein JWQ71_4502, partial [Pedosphaera sp.]|nr:hypothetical protein [Pedosphaera sp.]